MRLNFSGQSEDFGPTQKKNNLLFYFLQVFCIANHIIAFSSIYFYSDHHFFIASNYFPVLMPWLLFQNTPVKCFRRVSQFKFAKEALLHY